RRRGDDDPAAPSVPWYVRVPWPLWILLVGFLLAAAAAGLVYYKLPGQGFTFSTAALAIVAGVVCLVVYHKKEPEAQEREPEYRPRTKVYREADCKIDQALAMKLAKAEEVLVNRAREQNWEVAWDKHEKHHAAAQEALAAGDFPGAFRETCRAMQP